MRLSERFSEKFIWLLVLLAGALGVAWIWFLGNNQPYQSNASQYLKSGDMASKDGGSCLKGADVQSAEKDEVYFVGCGGIF